MPLDSCNCQGQGSSAEQKSGTLLLPFSCHSRKGEHTWNQFVIRVAGAGRRDLFREKLLRADIQTEIYYPAAMHHQECFRGSKGVYPVAEKLCKEVIALPILASFEGLFPFHNS